MSESVANATSTNETTAGITELVFVIDRSGSMGGLESDTIGGVNSVLARNRAEEGDAFVTTILFDHKISYLHDHVDLRKVANLTRADYWVRGCTALLDAVGDAITHVEKVQGYLPEQFRAKHVVCTIVTDGLENASRVFTYPRVKALIEQKRAEGWEFLFLGANIDVASEATRLGIAQEYATPYVADGAGTQIAYQAVGQAHARMRRCGKATPDWADAVRADAAARG